MPQELSFDTLIFAANSVKLGFVTIEQLASAVSACRQAPDRAVADVLVEMGAITVEQRRLVEEQTEDLCDNLDTMASVFTEASTEPKPEPVVRSAAQELADIDDMSKQWITVEQAGRYSSMREYAAGGQAQIFLTFDEHLRREVAVKEFRYEDGAMPASTPSTSQRRTLGMARFLREARVTGMLEHPNIVPVYELGRRPDGTCYYTMRFVRGKTLAQELRGCRTLSERLKLLGVFWDVAKAVAFAHSRGVVHRDIKPRNIMVGEFGETVVLDWGVAKVKGLKDIRARAIEKELAKLQVSSDMTTAGMAIGTPSYMSPEQARGEIDEIDERSDVWGLGALLYEILTGQVPYRGHDLLETLRLVVQAPLKPVGELCPEVSPDLAAVTHLALQKDKHKRYQSAKELADDIGAYLTGGKVRAYQYSSWELLRRFVARHKAVVITSGLMLIALVASLIVARQIRIQELEGEIDGLAERSGLLEHRLESLEKTRRDAFDAFDRDDHQEGEQKWSEAVYHTEQLEQEYADVWARLRGLLANRPESESGLALKAKVLRHLMQVSRYGGRSDLSDYYRQLLLENDREGAFQKWLGQPAKFTVLSRPAGALLELHRFTAGSKGLLQEEKLRDLGRAPVAELSLPPGSYLLIAKLKGREDVRMPFLAEHGEERVLSISLPDPGVIPEGMVYVPSGEFQEGSDEQEEIRRHTGAVPRHRSYTEAVLISRTEVTFAQYLPFVRELQPELRESYAPRGPFALREIDSPAGPILTCKGQSRKWGEKFSFEDCYKCPGQDWRQWPVVVSREAAEAFAKWKSEKLSQQGIKLELRIPSEREWEKAARGADGRKYPGGDELPKDHAVTRATHGVFNGVQQAGTFPRGRSVFGIDDLAGNVWEWVKVYPGEYALKGGSYRESPLMAMSASRVKAEDVYETHASGFRLAASLPGIEACPPEAPKGENQTIIIAQARACRDEGDRLEKRTEYDRSLAMYQRVLKLYQAAHGENHPDTAGAYTNIGRLHWMKGRYQKSQENIEKALTIIRDVLGPNHSKLAPLYRNLSILARSFKGSNDLALEYAEKSLKISLKAWGPDHPSTAHAYNAVGIFYDMTGSLDKALEYYQKTLEIRFRALGPDHKETASSYNNIGIVYKLKGMYDEALENFQKALDIRNRVLGPDHLQSAVELGNIGRLYYSIGSYDKAIEYLQKMLDIRLKVLGALHPDTASGYGTVGYMYYRKGFYDRALEDTNKALGIYAKVLGPDHPDTAASWTTLGEIHCSMGSPDQAIEYFQKALDIRIKVQGLEHVRTAGTFAFFAWAYCEKGSYDKALSHYQKALAVIEAKSGPAHKQTVSIYLGLAHVHRELGHQEKAAEYLEKALTNGEKVCGKKVVSACADAAVARCEKGHCDKKAMALAEKGIGLAPTHPDALEAKAFILYKQGRQKEAKRLYCRIKSLGPLSHCASHQRLIKACP